MSERYYDCGPLPARPRSKKSGQFKRAVLWTIWGLAMGGLVLAFFYAAIDLLTSLARWVPQVY